MKKLTIKEIAQLAGVSRATVSRVMTNHPNVHEKTRAAVLKVIQEHGYRPNAVAQSLASGRMKTIELILSDIRNPFYSEMARGVEDVARAFNYRVILANTDDQTDRIIESLESSRDYQVAGVILTSAFENPRIRQALMSVSSPVVLMMRFLKDMNYDAVIFDDELGGYLATKHLIDLGHRRVGHLAGPAASSASRGRTVGYKKAMAENGLSIDESWILAGDLKYEAGVRYANFLKENGWPVTAVFAGNDMMAIGLLDALYREGLRVPEDISIVGYDDISLAGLRGVGLTTIRVPQYEIGRAAAEILLNKITGTSQGYRKVVFQPELVVRQTTQTLAVSTQENKPA